MIEASYALKEGNESDWTGGLLTLKESRVRDHLGEDSPVFASIRRAGECLARVRELVFGSEGAARVTPSDVSVEVADEVNEAMSRFSRNPAFRFYNSIVSAHTALIACSCKRAPKNLLHLPWSDAEYHAVVSHVFTLEIASLKHRRDNKPSSEVTSEVIKYMSACLRARPNDATMHLSMGNFSMANGLTEGAREHLEKALRIDEKGCYGAHYTLANMLRNIVPSADEVNQLGRTRQLQVLEVTMSCRTHLQRYLALAPVGHWHAHRACMILITRNVFLSFRGNETAEAVERRIPGFGAKNHDLFMRGVEALTLYSNCYGRESKDFNHEYRYAAAVATMFHRRELVPPDRTLPDCKYICANPNCTDGGCRVEDAIVPLRACKACGAVRYCSRACQIEHWRMKDGHKHDCKRLARERKTLRKLPRHKGQLDNACPIIGE